MDATNNAEVASLNVVRCSSCGKNHDAIVPKKLDRTRRNELDCSSGWSHYFNCPESGEPVYVRFYAEQL